MSRILEYLNSDVERTKYFSFSSFLVMLVILTVLKMTELYFSFYPDSFSELSDLDVVLFSVITGSISGIIRELDKKADKTN